MKVFREHFAEITIDPLIARQNLHRVDLYSPNSIDEACHVHLRIHYY